MSNHNLKKSLTSRHVLMIALGSAIGTGFFFGTGKSIQLTGPSILLAYILGGIMMYIVVRALGEMSVAEPNSGSFVFFAHKYVNNYLGFVAGWNYWFNYILVCMIELTACSLFIDYWLPSSSHWLTTSIVMIVFLFINDLSVRIFGEIEFWFAGIKILAVVGLIVFGLYILGFHQQLDSSMAHINNLWSEGHFFANGIPGFLFSFVIVVFSFGGTELVGITAGETENPQKNIPLAINGIIGRIILFYVVTLAIVICLYPWEKLNANISPFVDVFYQMGITKAASLMNFVAITAALSSLNSGIYGTGRMLYNLSLQGNAPRLFSHLSKNGIPKRAVLGSMICIAFTVLLNFLYPKTIFIILLAIATLSAIINWLMILITHFYFKRQVKNTEYPLFAYPCSSIITIIFLVLVSSTMFFMPDFKMAVIIAPIWIFLLSLGYYLKTTHTNYRHKLNKQRNLL